MLLRDERVDVEPRFRDQGAHGRRFGEEVVHDGAAGPVMAVDPSDERNARSRAVLRLQTGESAFSALALS
jgi:hypothetical protein